MKKVIIDIYPDGSSKVDAEGFKGQSCSLATKDLELALAGNAGGVEDRKKPDFYQSHSNGQTQKS